MSDKLQFLIGDLTVMGGSWMANAGKAALTSRMY